MTKVCIASTSRVQNSGIIIALNAVHNIRLQAGIGNNSKDRQMKCVLPKGIDVVLQSDLVFTFSVLVNGQRQPPTFVQQSSFCRHFLQYLKKNADRISILAVSDMYLDEDDGVTKVKVTHSHSYPTLDSEHTAILLAIDITYSLKSVEEMEGLEFRRTCFSLCNDLLSNFISNALMKRYPLIFTSLPQKLQSEQKYFTSISRSVLSMISRSTNPEFCEQASRYIRIIRKRIRFIENTKGDLLSGYLPASKTSDEPTSAKDTGVPDSKDSDEDVICFGLAHLLKSSFKSPRFRGNPVALDDLDGLRSALSETGSAAGTKASVLKLVNDHATQNTHPSIDYMPFLSNDVPHFEDLFSDIQNLEEISINYDTDSTSDLLDLNSDDAVNESEGSDILSDDVEAVVDDFDLDSHGLLSRFDHYCFLTEHEKSNDDISIHTRSSSAASAIHIEEDSFGGFIEENTSDDDMILFNDNDRSYEDFSGDNSEPKSLSVTSQLTGKDSTDFQVSELLGNSKYMTSASYSIFAEDLGGLLEEEGPIYDLIAEYEDGNSLLDDSELMDYSSISIG